MASKLPECPLCGAKCVRDAQYALCDSDGRACRYVVLAATHRALCALIAKLRKAARPKGKVLARGHIGEHHAKAMLCRRPKGAKCNGCFDQESCWLVEVRAAGKGGRG